jgi:hypothetical protein
LSVGDVLLAISEAGLTLTPSKTEDTLKVYPAENITRELAEAIREHKAEIISVLRENERLRSTGIISVLSGSLDRADAAVISQVWNVYLRAMSTEIKLLELGELEARLRVLEERYAETEGGRPAWRT